MLETVVLTVGGKRLEHKRCSLSANAEKAVRTADFDLAWGGPNLPCEEDEEATVRVSGELWLTGYVGDVKPSMSATSREYAVSLVSRTIDATEASIDHPTGLRTKCDLRNIAEEFDSYGVGVDCDADTLRKARHKVRPGETLFETLETDARAQGVLIYDTPKGRLKLTSKPEGRHAGALAQGINITSASASLSGRGNFSEIRIRGQASDGTAGTALRPEAKATGTGRRKRILIRIHEGEATSDRIKKRAGWEARRAAGLSKTCSIVVPGWRDKDGRIWAPNFLVEVRAPWLGVEQEMIIASVRLEQDSQDGTTATIECKDPRALGGENPRGKSAKAWAAPNAIEIDFREGN